MKWSGLFGVAALIGSVSTVHAGETPSPGVGPGARFHQDLNPSGVVRLDYFRSSKTLDAEADFFGVSTQLKLLPELGRNFDAKAEIRIMGPPIGKGGDAHTHLLEGYVTWHLLKADLRIGRQIVAWGRADGINPTDNLTPRDYVVLLPFEDDQRLGITAAKLDVFLTSELTLGVFASPYFEPHKIPFPTTGGSLERKLPSRTFTNTEYGLKLNKSGEGFDWSLSYFHGFNLLPSLRAGRVESERRVRTHYDRIRVYGGDFARNFGRLGVRGEFAYMDTGDRTGNDNRTINPNLFFIVGVDRTFFDNLNVNVQYFRRQVRHFRSPADMLDPRERHIASESALLTAQRNRVSDGISFRISNKWLHDTLEAEIFGIINFTTRDGFARPQVSYALSDHWKATLGYDWFQGARDTQFGSLKSNRGAFVETRFSF